MIDWNRTKEEVNEGTKYDTYFVGGAFSIYHSILLNSKEEALTDMMNTLEYYKLIYVLALKNNFISLCDYITNIDSGMMIQAATDIKEYMMKHINSFGEKPAGLLKICFEQLKLANRGIESIDRGYWERVLKETFELYRMISD